MRRPPRAVAALVIGTLLLPTGQAPSLVLPVPEAALASVGLSPEDDFGHAVAMDGDLAVVGAPYDEGVYSDSGSVSVYRRTAPALWSLEATLSPGADARVLFGWDVAVSGDTILVGALFADSPAGIQTGAAYVYTRQGSGWALQAKLFASQGMSLDYFGLAVALEGDTALIGAPEPFWAGPGAAHVFTRSGGVWTQEAQLTAPDEEPGDLFGISVAVDGDTALVGAYWDDTTREQAGSVHAYARSGTSWTHEAMLTAGGPQDRAWFGSALALDDGTAVVGAPTWPGGAGEAYVFVRSGGSWAQEARIVASDPTGSDGFGFSVAVLGGVAVVGAPAQQNGRGAAYVFARSATGWAQEAKLTAREGAEGDRFGFVAAGRLDAVSQGILVGAPLDDVEAGADAGAAYTFLRISV